MNPTSTDPRSPASDDQGDPTCFQPDIRVGLGHLIRPGPGRRAQTARHPAPGRVLAAGLRVRRHHARHHPADPAVRHLPGPVAFRGQHRHADLRRLRRRGAGRPAAGGPVLGPGRAQAGAGRGPRRQRAEHGRVHPRPRRGSAPGRPDRVRAVRRSHDRYGHGRAHRTGPGLGRPPGLAGGHGREHGRPGPRRARRRAVRPVRAASHHAGVRGLPGGAGHRGRVSAVRARNGEPPPAARPALRRHQPPRAGPRRVHRRRRGRVRRLFPARAVLRAGAHLPRQHHARAEPRRAGRRRVPDLRGGDPHPARWCPGSAAAGSCWPGWACSWPAWA